MNELKFPLLGLDVSKRRIGVAIAEGITADPLPLFTWPRGKKTVDFERIANWVRKYGIVGVVVGLPVNMDGTVGDSAEKMEQFIAELSQKITVPIYRQDERQTTLEAREILDLNELDAEETKEKLDEIAAVLILTRFINEKR
ncbi:MAG: Holliday junction resolvase RuvX [bacterium]